MLFDDHKSAVPRNKAFSFFFRLTSEHIVVPAPSKAYDQINTKMTKRNPRGGFIPSAAVAAAMAVSIVLTSSSVVDAFSIAPSRPSPTALTHRSSLRPRSMVALAPASPTAATNIKSLRWAKTEDNDDDIAVPLQESNIKSMRWAKTDGDNDDIASSTALETSTDDTSIETDDPVMKTLSDMGKGLAEMMNFVTSKHSALAATVLLFLTVFLSPLPSQAVTSGGSMGGSFGASQRQSYSAPSRSYSSPSYGSSYGSGYSRGFSSGYYSRPSVVINPTPIMPRPFYSPFWAPTYYSRPVGVVSTGGGFGLIGFVTFFGIALAAMSAMSTFVGSAGSGVMNRVDEAVGGALGPGVSVAEISVAVDVPNRDDPNSILSVLNRLSNTARTDSRVGMSNLTSQGK